MNKKCSIELKLRISLCKMHFAHMIKINTNKRILVQMNKKMFNCTNIHRKKTLVEFERFFCWKCSFALVR